MSLNKTKNLINQIFQITTEIQADFPELYMYLDETSVPVFYVDHITNFELERYLTTITLQLRTFEANYLMRLQPGSRVNTMEQ